MLRLRLHERLDSAFGDPIYAYTRMHNDFDANNKIGRFAAVLANNPATPYKHPTTSFLCDLSIEVELASNRLRKRR